MPENVTENEPKKRGRKMIPLNRELFEAACSLQCTTAEILLLLKCNTEKLKKWCAEEYGEPYPKVYEKLSASGKMSLRRTQFKLAENNVQMAIWLGKQYLGQRDPEKKLAADIGEEITNDNVTKFTKIIGL